MRLAKRMTCEYLIKGSMIPTSKAPSSMLRSNSEEQHSILHLSSEPLTFVTLSPCHLVTFSPSLTHHSRFLPSAPSPEADATEPICILIDSISLTLLRGSTIDYVTELIGSQFAIKDNPQAKGAGCGCGVSWEPKV